MPLEPRLRPLLAGVHPSRVAAVVGDAAVEGALRDQAQVREERRVDVGGVGHGFTGEWVQSWERSAVCLTHLTSDSSFLIS